MRGVIVHMLASSTVDQGLEPRPGQTKDYKIDISFISAQLDLAVFESKNTDWLAVNLDTVSMWS